MQPTRKINPAIAALIVIVLVGIVTAIAVAVRNQSEDATVSETSKQDTTQPSSSVNNQNASYKDGEYTETGKYISPGGQESIEVTLILSGGTITDATVIGDATSGEAKEYQEKFISSYKQNVVGKDVDEVSLSRVAGSSLTSNGFNDALELIKADARV